MQACVECGAMLLLAAQSCSTLWDPMDCSPPGSSVRGILQTRTLEWAAMPSSRGSYQPRDQAQVSRVSGGFFTIWVTSQVQEYWSGWPIPSPGDLPNPGVTPVSLTSPALAGGLFTTDATWSTQKNGTRSEEQKNQRDDFLCSALRRLGRYHPFYFFLFKQKHKAISSPYRNWKKKATTCFLVENDLTYKFIYLTVLNQGRFTFIFFIESL